jgi:hypothetical protein
MTDFAANARSLINRSELETEAAHGMLLMIKTQIVLLELLGLWTLSIVRYFKGH